LATGTPEVEPLSAAFGASDPEHPLAASAKMATQISALIRMLFFMSKLSTQFQ
jgi:hypothetical protein